MRIIICGSMSVSPAMVEAADRLIALGRNVELPLFAREYAKGGDQALIERRSLREKTEHDLIRGYFEIIKSGDAVLIVNSERKGIPGYIGGNAFLEMGFAHVLGKKLFLLHPVPAMAYADEIRAMQPVILNGDVSKLA